MRKKAQRRIQSGGSIRAKIGGLVSSETNVGGSGRSREKQKKNVEGCGLRPSPIGEQRRKLKNENFQNLIPC